MIIIIIAIILFTVDSFVKLHYFILKVCIDINTKESQFSIFWYDV